jgi:hypothetical protein
MVMRTTTFAALLVAVVCASACNKPSEPECRKAIANMRRLLETDKNNVTGNVESAVRRCRGSSTKKSVVCATEAQSLAELGECGLLPPPAAADDKKAEAAPEPSAAPPSPAPEQAREPAAAPPAEPAPTTGAPPLGSPPPAAPESPPAPAPGSTTPAPEPATR